MTQTYFRFQGWNSHVHGEVPGSLSQQILAGIALVGRLGVDLPASLHINSSYSIHSNSSYSMHSNSSYLFIVIVAILTMKKLASLRQAARPDAAFQRASTHVIAGL